MCYYDDPYYSILSISFTDSGLLKKILETLIRIRPEVNHPELEILIEKLTGLSGIKSSTEIMEHTLDYRIQDFPAGIRYNLSRSAKTGFPSGPVREAAKKIDKEAALQIPGDFALCRGDVLG